MPRNVIDLSITQTVLSKFDVKFVVRDLLNETFTWKQMGNNVLTTKKGRSLSLSFGYKL
jgi:DNA replicative helicase MCM subunit Mcm2 (Cdc46/Mcm family)